MSAWDYVNSMYYPKLNIKSKTLSLKIPSFHECLQWSVGRI